MAHTWDANHNWQLSVALEKYTGGFTSLVLSLTKKFLRLSDSDLWKRESKPGRQGRLPGCNAAGYYSASTTVYFESITHGNANQLVLQSKYTSLDFGYSQNLADLLDSCAFSNFSLNIDVATSPLRTDDMFQVKFSTRQTGSKSVRTVGEIRLLNDPDPIGVFTMTGSYIGQEWKLHVLDQATAP